MKNDQDRMYEFLKDSPLIHAWRDFELTLREVAVSVTRDLHYDAHQNVWMNDAGKPVDPIRVMQMYLLMDLTGMLPGGASQEFMSLVVYEGKTVAEAWQLAGKEAV